MNIRAPFDRLLSPPPDCFSELRRQETAEDLLAAARRNHLCVRPAGGVEADLARRASDLLNTAMSFDGGAEDRNGNAGEAAVVDVELAGRWLTARAHRDLHGEVFGEATLEHVETGSLNVQVAGHVNKTRLNGASAVSFYLAEERTSLSILEPSYHRREVILVAARGGLTVIEQPESMLQSRP